jgi:hypothetical protein
VFWRVGSSATLHSSASFAGTIMAQVAVTAETAATIEGRLFARTGAVTTDTNVITTPTGCADASLSVVTTTPTITSGTPTAGSAGTPYSFRITSDASPTATYAVTGGALPTGLTLDPVTGLISGTPTTAGTFSFTITASNGSAPNSVVSYSLAIANAQLAATGIDMAPLITGGALVLIIAGVLFTLYRPRLRPAAQATRQPSGGR